MLAGYTKSGKPIYKSLCISRGKFSVIGRSFLAEDHFDAHCVFLYLAVLEKAMHGENEFHRHYDFMSNVHHHALLVAKPAARPALLMLETEEKVKHGQSLANLSQIAFHA